ncbi:MAG: hypothetical protein CMJ84_00425 [Planctomycetes bacterium]|jgi:hypothetical protein|nr:hypothetical protein [Planctomycetota bacterium]MDP6410637.1 hypothetical protein [Planctomycetota bacterium]
MIGALLMVVIAALLLWWAARGSERDLVLAALAVRLVMVGLAWLFFVPRDGTWVMSASDTADDLKYFEGGLTALRHGTLWIDPALLGAGRNPGFVYVVGALFLLFGKIWFLPNAVSFVSGLALPVAVVRLAEAVGLDRRRALAAGWIIVFLPTIAFFSVTGYKDQLTILLLTLLLTSGAHAVGGRLTVARLGAVLVLTALMAVFRVGLLPLIAGTFCLLALGGRGWKASAVALSLLAASIWPFTLWLESTEQLDRFTVIQITEGSVAGMASQVLSGGIATWPLRATLFLILPYPSLTGLDDAWQLYHWLNLGWYFLLCMGAVGVAALWRSWRETTDRMLLLPIVWTAAVVLSLMVRGMPNTRYILTVVPAVALMGSYAVVDGRLMRTALMLLGAGCATAVPAYFVLRGLF